MIKLWNDISEKNKFLITVALSILCMPVLWEVSFRETNELFDLRQSIKSEKDSLSVFFGSSANFRQEDNLGPSLKGVPSISEAQLNLLRCLETQTNSELLKIDQILEPQTFELHGREIVQLSFVSNGGFHEQVRLLTALENGLNALYVQSISLRTKIDPRTKVKKLYQHVTIHAVIT